MPAIGPLEILTIAVIALLVFGPEKLPDMARTVAKTLGEMRRMASDVQAEFKAGLEVEDDKEVSTTNGKVAGHPVERAIAADKEMTSRADDEPAPAPERAAAPEITNKPDAGPVGPSAADGS